MEYPVIPAIWIKNYIIPSIAKEYGLQHQPKNIQEGIVLCGWRHGAIIQMACIITSKPIWKFDTVQGFLTNYNRFVDREEALKLHIAAGKTAMSNKELYSEDLY